MSRWNPNSGSRDLGINCLWRVVISSHLLCGSESSCETPLNMACFVFYKFYYCPECVDEELLMPCISGMNWDVELNVISSLLIFSRLILPLGVFSTTVFLSSSMLILPLLNLCNLSLIFVITETSRSHLTIKIFYSMSLIVGEFRGQLNWQVIVPFKWTYIF